MRLPSHVTDVNGVRYQLDRFLGQGAQGTVASVSGGRLAVKLLHERSASQRERLRNKLHMVHRLPLADLRVARPLEMLREPHVGYVMELLTDMQPLHRLMCPSRSARSLAKWYIQGGGLRRRLRVLARAADTLSSLHGKALAYGDLSPHNVFVSEDLEASEVWLIDADNLCYESSPASAQAYTPGYGAPELVAGRSGANTLTDAFAFAVLAFQVVAIVHPFIGDMVSDGEPELEERGFAGDLPWIEDTADSSNRASSGVPRDWILSSKLRELWGRVFSLGMRNPFERPGMSLWAERLHTAADATLVCPDCRSSFFFNAACCPWCDSPRPRFLRASICLWDPAMDGRGGFLPLPGGQQSARHVTVAQVVATETTPLSLTRRLTCGHTGSHAELPVASVVLQGRQLRLRSLDRSGSLFVSSARGRQQVLTEEWYTVTVAEDQPSCCLHLGPMDQLHRAVVFAVGKGGAA